MWADGKGGGDPWGGDDGLKNRCKASGVLVKTPAKYVGSEPFNVKSLKVIRTIATT